MECALARVGGNWNNGSNAGPSYWNLNNTSSNTNVNIGRQTLIENILMHSVILATWRKLRP